VLCGDGHDLEAAPVGRQQYDSRPRSRQPAGLFGDDLEGRPMFVDDAATDPSIQRSRCWAASYSRALPIAMPASVARTRTIARS
jgi:hypothetical protein